MIKIIHYRDKCLGCAYCVEVAPSLFTINTEDGKVDLVEGKFIHNFQTVEYPDIFLSEAKEAESVCPAKIIVVK